MLVLSGNKLKHFNEYHEDKSTTLTEFSVEENSSLINKSIKDANIPDDVLIVMIKRKGEVLVPNGNTIILPEDILVVTSNNMSEVEELLSV
ncbi:MAG: TrkA C-terminal domain-containing protein [Clostridium saudiense]|nr:MULTISPECIES: TrkA C-terminal domain-containing protein [Clostridium]MDU3522842.1 TrkA C-terminal domain-containing protein [Clostridium saudiense]